MKKLGSIVLLVGLVLVLVASSAWAVPYDSNNNVLANTTGFSWVDSPYWTITDGTTYEEGTTAFTLTKENAAYESDFGLFIVDDIANPNSATIKKFEIFSASDEPDDLDTFLDVIFKYTAGSGWEVAGAHNQAEANAATWTPFGITFGFYYGVHVKTDDGAIDYNLVDYTYYSDPRLNTVDQGDQHVAVEWNGIDDVRIYLEDLRSANADWDWLDMKIYGDDLKPIPEPGTLALLGLGLFGLAVVRRRRK